MALNHLINSMSAHKARSDEHIHRFLDSVSPYMHQHAQVGQKAFEREVTGGGVEATTAPHNSSSQGKGSEWLQTRGELQDKLERREVRLLPHGGDTSAAHIINFSRADGPKGVATVRRRRPYDHQHCAPSRSVSTTSSHKTNEEDIRQREVQRDSRRHGTGSRTHRLVPPYDGSAFYIEEQRRCEGQRLALMGSQEREGSENYSGPGRAILD